MRKSYLKSFAMVAALAVAVSGAASADPLAPGKPAGVHAAQAGSKEWLVIGGLAAVAATILILNAGSGHDQAPAQTVAVIVPPAAP